jgi:protocatechuate 4,5-dioxygenase, beta chain
MATVAAVIASTHHPFYYRASTSTGADRPPFADEWVAKIESFREMLTRAGPTSWSSPCSSPSSNGITRSR